MACLSNKLIHRNHTCGCITQKSVTYSSNVFHYFHNIEQVNIISSFNNKLFILVTEISITSLFQLGLTNDQKNYMLENHYYSIYLNAARSVQV